MSDTIPRSVFFLGEWQICPRLNLLKRGTAEVHIEPKMMDVLAVLKVHSGEVVSKQQLSDVVWSDVIITESVITRAIAGLRKALGDNVKSPRFIQTISKRGYRLLDQASIVPDEQVLPAETATMPYVVGQWVRGQRFYGRAQLINEVLHGNRSLMWLLGTRRVGKTSLLKQLEYLTSKSAEYLPLYWDLQGAEEPQDLHLDFADALLDAEPLLERVGIQVSDIEDDDLFVSLGRLRRSLRNRGSCLLLLCDEAEALIQLQLCDAGVVRKFRRAVQSSEGIRCVISASGRLWNLGKNDDPTSPFLDGFAPPSFVGTLEDGEAEKLVCQVHLPENARPRISRETAAEVAKHCGNHPYLMQMLGRRVLELGDVDVAIEKLAAEQTVAHFFAVDMGVLDDDEQAGLKSIVADRGREVEAGCVDRLIRLGLVRLNERGKPGIANVFLERWLRG